MKVWLDAQLSPVLANWMRSTFQLTAFPMRDLGMLKGSDEHIFMRAKKEADIVSLWNSSHCAVVIAKVS